MRERSTLSSGTFNPSEALKYLSHIKKLENVLKIQREQQIRSMQNRLFITNAHQEVFAGKKNLTNLIAEFIQATKTKVAFLFMVSKAVAVGSKITEQLDLSLLKTHMLPLAIRQLPKKIIGIRSLRIGHTTTVNLIKQLSQHITHLKTLDFSRCFNNIRSTSYGIIMQRCKITNSGLKHFADNCPHLTQINFSNCNGQFTYSFTDEGIIYLAQKCKKITHVDLSRDFSLTYKALLNLAINCKKLTRLKIKHGSNMLKTRFETWIKHCKNLRELDLESCENTDDEKLRLIADSCPLLTNLNVYECSNITDEGLIYLMKKCHHIQHLNVSLCNNISDKALVFFAKKNQSAALSIHMSGCDKITNLTI